MLECLGQQVALGTPVPSFSRPVKMSVNAGIVSPAVTRYPCFLSATRSRATLLIAFETFAPNVTRRKSSGEEDENPRKTDTNARVRKMANGAVRADNGIRNSQRPDNRRCFKGPRGCGGAGGGRPDRTWTRITKQIDEGMKQVLVGRKVTAIPEGAAACSRDQRHRPAVSRTRPPCRCSCRCELQGVPRDVPHGPTRRKTLSR